MTASVPAVNKGMPNIALNKLLLIDTLYCMLLGRQQRQSQQQLTAAYTCGFWHLWHRHIIPVFLVKVAFWPAQHYKLTLLHSVCSNVHPDWPQRFALKLGQTQLCGRKKSKLASFVPNFQNSLWRDWSAQSSAAGQVPERQPSCCAIALDDRYTAATPVLIGQQPQYDVAH